VGLSYAKLKIIEIGSKTQKQERKLKQRKLRIWYRNFRIITETSPSLGGSRNLPLFTYFPFPKLQNTPLYTSSPTTFMVVVLIKTNSSIFLLPRIDLCNRRLCSNTILKFAIIYISGLQIVPYYWQGHP